MKLIFWNIYDIFFSLQSYLFILWKTRVLQVRVRSRQKFGTNRKKCSTNVKHRHVGINRRLIVQFNSNPRVQRLQNGHRNNSASGWRTTTTLLNMRFLFLRHSLHVCTWFASPLPALFAARVTKRNENVKKKWFYEHNNNSAPASLFSNFFVVHAQLRRHITKYDFGYLATSHEPGYFWNRILFFNTNPPSVSTKQVNLVTETALFWNRSPEPIMSRPRPHESRWYIDFRKPGLKAKLSLTFSLLKQKI